VIAPPERSAERDAALEALLPLVPQLGWAGAVRRASPTEGDVLFPGGIAEVIEAFFDLADRRMEEAAAGAGLGEMRTPQRVRTLIVLRLTWLRPHREAVRRALGVLALPRHARVAARCTARTVDAVWHAAGDKSADFSWYTKRATLAAVYGTTLLAWLRDDGEDEATLAFLDRRLEGVADIGRLRRRIEEAVARWWPGAAADG
jgi:ubiquinone biosynthesis protein COQ9